MALAERASGDAVEVGAAGFAAAQIARGLREHDIDVVQMLVGEYQDRLVRYLMYVLGRRDGVDDLVQETWLRVLEKGKSYDGRSRFEPWLFTVARNLTVDSLRRRRETSLDAEDDGRPVVAEPVSQEASPFVMAARTEDAERMAAVLAGLRPVYREALVLRFVEEMSLQEIGVVTGAPVPTVAARVYRGLAALRAQMEDRHEH